jgi:hypothetical protein
MKRVAAIIASLLLPGLGQAIYGRFGWALTFLFGPVGNALSALHVLFIKD